MSTDQPTPPNSGTRPTNERPGQGSGAQPPGNGFLTSLTDLETRINQIKAAHEQAAVRDLELSGKEAGLAAREQDLAERERSIAARMVKAEAELTRAQRELAEAEAARVEAAETMKQVEAARAQEGEQRSALERERSALAEARQHAEQERQELEFDLKAQRDEIERDRASVAEHARTLAEQMKRSDDEQNAAIWSNRVEAIQIQLGESNAARARLETELAQTRQDVESLTQELIDANNARGVPREEVEKRDKTIADLANRLDEATAATTMLEQQAKASAAAAKEAQEQAARAASERDARVAERDAQIQAQNKQREESEAAAKARIDEVQSTLAAKSRELDEATNMLAARDRQISETARAMKEQAEKAAAVAAESESLKQELGAARELLDHAEAVSKSRVSEEEVRTRDATIAGLNEALRAAERIAAEASHQQEESNAAAVADLSARLQAAEQAAAAHASDAGEAAATELRERDRHIESLQARLDAMQAELASRAPTTELESRDAAIADLNAKLAELSERAAQAEAAGVAAAENAAAAEQETDRHAQEEIAKRDEAITILKQRLDEALAAASEIGESERSAPNEPSRPTDADYRRRDRLRRYKAMLQGQARKIVAAQSAIQRRHADCEAVLQNRAKLVQLAHQLAKAEKQVTAAKARSGAAAAVLYFTATLSILAVMSWEVSKRTWPGTYIARAVLEAETGRVAPKPEDLAAWQKDHAELLSDPRLMEVAAQRMQQRGLTTLGTAPELSARIKQDMYVQSGKPGSLTVELRGEGAEKTALVLDTLVTAFKSVSDQGRDERANDLGVVIAQAATAGAEPLMDKRIEKAASVFGGAALAAGLAGLVIWTRLVRAKRKFDRAGEVEAALGDVDWGTLEASIKQSAAAAEKARPAAQ